MTASMVRREVLSYKPWLAESDSVKSDKHFNTKHRTRRAVLVCHGLKLTRVRVERGCGPTGGLSAPGAEAEEVLNVGGEQLPPGAVGVVQQDRVDDEGQQPLAAIHHHLETDRGGQERFSLELLISDQYQTLI